MTHSRHVQRSAGLRFGGSYPGILIRSETSGEGNVTPPPC